MVSGAGAQVLGAITIGAHSRVGANAVVVREKSHRPTGEKADVEHGRLPDTITETLAALIAHVEALEKRVNGGGVYRPALHAPEQGVWHGSDFSI